MPDQPADGTPADDPWTPKTPENGSAPELVDRRADNARRRVWIATAAAVVVVAAVGVGVVVNRADAADTGDDPTDGPATAAGESDDATLVVGLALEPTNLDIRTTSGAALDQALIGNVYETLVGRDADGAPTPALATAWTVSDDALTYTFALADGVSFSNGDALTAADVVWSLDDLVAAEGVDSDALAKVADVTAPDDGTVVITLTEPQPALLWQLSGRAGLVLDADATNDLESSAIGSGPFLLDDWKQGDSITLVRNDAYWGDPAGVGTVVLRYIPDTNAALNAFNGGDLDVLAPVDALLGDQVTVPDASLVEGAASDKFVLAFNNAVAPFTDLRVRQAIRYAIDHEALVDARGGVDHVLGGPIPEGDPGYEDLTDLYPHDPDKARALLSAAGFPAGLTLELTIPSFYATTLSDLLVSQLAEVGITLTVQQVDFSTWLQDVYTNHDYQLSIVDHAESHDVGAWADPTYYFGYANPAVQDTYARASVAGSADEYESLLAEVGRTVSQDAAADWLVNFRTVTAVAPGVHGFPTDQINSRLELAGVTTDA